MGRIKEVAKGIKNELKREENIKKLKEAKEKLGGDWTIAFEDYCKKSCLKYEVNKYESYEPLISIYYSDNTYKAIVSLDHFTYKSAKSEEVVTALKEAYEKYIGLLNDFVQGAEKVEEEIFPKGGKDE